MYVILKHGCTDFPKTLQAFQNSSASRVPRRKCHTGDLQLLDTTVQNSDPRATWRPRFVRRWLRNHSVSFPLYHQAIQGDTVTVVLSVQRLCFDVSVDVEKKGRDYACDGAASRFCFSTVRVLDQGSLLGTGRPLLL